MGMFDKDKEIGRPLVGAFDYKDELILWDVDPLDEPITGPNIVGGSANKTRLYVSRLDSPNDKFEVSTLSQPIYDKAQEANSEEFPCVVQLLQVPTDKGNPATVLQYVREWPQARSHSTGDRSDAQPPSPAGSGGTF